MSSVATIYVPLLNERTETWRPVRAEVLPSGRYRILDDMPADERWAFASGSVVRCEPQMFNSGKAGLAAVESA